MNTSTSTYIPSFLEKILGKNYKWWYIVRYYFKLGGAYFITNLLHFFGQSISIYSAVIIWSYTTNSSEIITNLVFGLILFSLSTNTIYWDLGGSIEKGSISKNLILPTSFIKYMFFISMGFLIRIAMYYVIILTPIFIFLSNRLILNFSLFTLVLILIQLCLGFLIRYLLAFLLGLSAFWTTQVYGQANFYENLIPLLLGIIFPYNLIPLIWLRSILQILPLSFVVHHPMQIYLGNYDNVQTGWTLLGGLAWCLVLYFLAKLVFKAGLKRNESVGL